MAAGAEKISVNSPALERPDLIDALSDPQVAIQQAARQTLKLLANNQDHGPEPGATPEAHIDASGAPATIRPTEARSTRPRTAEIKSAKRRGTVEEAEQP